MLTEDDLIDILEDEYQVKYYCVPTNDVLYVITEKLFMKLVNNNCYYIDIITISMYMSDDLYWYYTYECKYNFSLLKLDIKNVIEFKLCEIVDSEHNITPKLILEKMNMISGLNRKLKIQSLNL